MLKQVQELRLKLRSSAAPAAAEEHLREAGSAAFARATSHRWARSRESSTRWRSSSSARKSLKERNPRRSAAGRQGAQGAGGGLQRAPQNLQGSTPTRCDAVRTEQNPGQKKDVRYLFDRPNMYYFFYRKHSNQFAP